MIRVLQVVTHMNRGGLETMIMNCYRHINREEMQFDFLTHRPYDGDYGNEIHQLGGIIYHLPVLNPFSIIYKKELVRFFKEHPEYKLIHVHQDCMSSIILKVAKQCGVKIRIAHSHSTSQDKNLKYLIKLYYNKFIPKYSTELMACGNEAGKWMFNQHNFKVINNAIESINYIYNDEKRKNMRLQLGIDSNELLVGNVGRFCFPKNHQFLLEIFKCIREERPAKLLLIGDGELRSNIENQIKLLGIENDVILTGIRSDVADLLQAMDVFLFPSIYEGLPVALIEAQASGLPCLISDTIPKESCITDLVELYSLNQSAHDWANRVNELLEQKKRKNTFDQIKNSGFDIEENANWLQQFYFSKLEMVK